MRVHARRDEKKKCKRRQTGRNGAKRTKAAELSKHHKRVLDHSPSSLSETFNPAEVKGNHQHCQRTTAELHKQMSHRPDWFQAFSCWLGVFVDPINKNTVAAYFTPLQLRAAAENGCVQMRGRTGGRCVFSAAVLSASDRFHSSR